MRYIGEIMVKKIKLGVILLSLSLLLTSCSVGDNEFKSMVKEVNEYNENIKVPDVDLSLYMNDLTEEEMLTWDEFSSFSNYNPKEFKSNKIYKNALRDDIELFFKALRTNYAPYNYFGGDEAFLKVKEETIEYIYSQEEIYDYEAIKFLTDKLSFVEDKHFHIGGTKTIHTTFMYADEKTDYFKDAEGYYKLNNDDKYYIKAIDGNENIEDNIKYSIGEEGNITYKAFVMRENNVTKGDAPITNKVNVEIVFYNEDGSELVEEVTLNIIGNEEYVGIPLLGYEEIDDISIVTMKAMRMNGEEEARNFAQSAIDSKKSKITIIDLRDNGGGEGAMPVLWLQSRFNKIIKSNSKGIFLERVLDQPEQVGDLSDSAIYDYFCFEPIENGYYKMQDKEDEGLVKNNKYIFVLIDKNTGSAGEFFIDLLRRVKNVVIVGSNSNGVLEGSYIDLFLPKTGINFGYGNWLRIYDEDVFEEGRGFMPDIIVNDDESLDKVLKMIEYYGLN